MLSIEEDIIAKCYVDRDGDEKNVCYLSKTSLHLNINNRLSSFFVQWITDITLKRKKYLMPIVIGGIVAPLAALGLFQYYLNPWLMMGILLIALLSIYYGYEGGLALCIVTPIKEYDFFIKTATPNLKAFLAYTKQAINEDSIKFYFKLKDDQWDLAKKVGEVIPEKQGLELSMLPINSKAPESSFYIESKDLPVEIKYVDDGSGNVVPKIFNPLPVAFINNIEQTD
ncbi:MAG TPA: hypothetical protein PKL31_12905 [Fulvivirga sp.]|nr:hypothetical protein [Fulvivirga sp.]